MHDEFISDCSLIRIEVVFRNGSGEIHLARVIFIEVTLV
jgi:hypothetical protein